MIGVSGDEPDRRDGVLAGIPMSDPIRFSLDGTEVSAEPGETIWQVADRQGIEIPHLCWLPKPGYRADGNCRACMVEIEGERVLAASCVRKPAAGMKVQTASERARFSRKMVFELLIGDQPSRAAAHDPNSRLWQWADKLGVSDSRFPRHAPPAPDRSHPAMAVQLDACIECTSLRPRLPRSAGQRRDRHGGARLPREDRLRFRRPDGQQHLRRLRRMRAGLPDRRTDAGEPGRCERRLHQRAGPRGRERLPLLRGRLPNHLPASATTASSRSTAGTGRPTTTGSASRAASASITSHHPDRLTEPLIRKDGVSKHDIDIDPANPYTHFRKASWDEALDLAAAGLKRIRDRDGRRALAGFGSAKGSNEEAYLFQKLVRTGFGSNNVDHCTRLCHASSVAALMEGIGSGAVTAPFTAAADADVIIVIGARPTENHPVAATFFKQAAKRGAKTYRDGPARLQVLTRYATATCCASSRRATSRCSTR